MATDVKSISYVVVSNIPKCYHSSDLRNFFSEFIETKGFDCFHFRHRPAIRIVQRPGNEVQEKHSEKTFCCIVRLETRKIGEFIRKYHGKHWLDREGFTLPLKCFISKARITDNDSSTTDSTDIHTIRYQTRKEQRTIPSSRVTFTKENLLNLTELKPPSVMPNGNVGTPTVVFLALIRDCRMPARLIGKFGLVFPKLRGKRKYGSVPFDYGSHLVRMEDEDEFEEDVKTARGQVLTDFYSRPRTEEEEPNKTHDDESEDDNDTCEEWERHEALHDDVTEQDRTKERLYEEEIELKWEKGGSGLVFYTDAQYWDEQKGDFDEKTADDWDVDMSVYYNKDGSGDQDAMDYVQMMLEAQRRDGILDSAFDRIGQFEKHTKGIGRKLLEKQGWKDGQGLGRTIQGMPTALDNDGRHPKNKKGLGYHGEKLPRFSTKKPKTNILISTIYDDSSVTDPPEPLLRRNPPTCLSHRSDVATIRFNRASET